MRQKYLITRNEETNQLSIKEFAVLEKTYKYIYNTDLAKDNFSFLYKETYDNEVIKFAIAEGKEVLINTLRTRNMFPIETYIDAIAESVIDLYSSQQNLSVELVFDDKDLL
jgi:hypothetical protein